MSELQLNLIEARINDGTIGDVNPGHLTKLVAIARAALVLVAKLESQGFVSRLSDAADPLYTALKAAP